MHAKVYVTSYVKGPVPPEPKGSRHISPWAFRIGDPEVCAGLRQSHDGDCRSERIFYQLEAVDPAKLRPGDMLLVEAGQLVHADGTIRRGAATIDESAITGDATHVLRESGHRNQVMRDTMIVSGTIVIEVTPRLGHSLDWIEHDRRVYDQLQAQIAKSDADPDCCKLTRKSQVNDACSGK
jgi:hypothetical protein